MSAPKATPFGAPLPYSTCNEIREFRTLILNQARENYSWFNLERRSYNLSTNLACPLLEYPQLLSSEWLLLAQGIQQPAALHFPRLRELIYFHTLSSSPAFKIIENQGGQAFIQTALQQAQRNCGLYPPATIVTDKAPTYPVLIQAMGEHAYYNEPVKHIDQKWRNNRIESDHAALKRITNLGKGFQTLRTVKATLLGIEAFRTIKRGDLFEPAPNPKAESRLVNQMFEIAA